MSTLDLPTRQESPWFTTTGRAVIAFLLFLAVGYLLFPTEAERQAQESRPWTTMSEGKIATF